MTAKRFEIIENSKNYLRVDDKTKRMFYLNEKEVIELLNEQHEENMLLIEDTEKHRKLAIQFDNRNKELVRENALLEKENEQLKSELNGMKLLLKSYRKTIEHNAKLLADATRNGYLPPLEDWKGDVE